jgi:hypothetical protein
MTEALLQYIWQTQQFNVQELRTVNGDPLFIIHPGYLNSNAGPDFLHAKVRINDTLWAGHIELHTRSREWYSHKHSEDPSYNNVVLHVVFQHNTDVYLFGHDKPLPTLELKSRISTSLLHLYRQFYKYNKVFACQDLFHVVDPSIVALTLQRMAVERLEEKAGQVEKLLHSLNGDWLHTLYCLVGRYMAGPVNGELMERLMIMLKPRWLLRIKNSLLQLEAMILGAAGLLSSPSDDYSFHRSREFELIKRKYPFHPMESYLWKYSRMRPDNFIDIRIAQFAQWIHVNDSIWSKILSCKGWKDLNEIFNIQLRHYWASHYRLGKRSKRKIKRLGKGSIERIVINALAPILFLYGREHDKETYQERAMNWLMDIPPEQNKITRLWKNLKVTADSSFESQGLLYWRKTYCVPKACAKCPVCHAILRENKNVQSIIRD